MSIDPIDPSAYKIFDLHMQILKEILIQTSFDQIKKKYQLEIQETNYLEIIKRCGHLSFDENGTLIGAYPISPIKTEYLVTVEGIGQGYSMCAIDALGIPFLFWSKTIIEAPDKSSDQKIVITIDPDSENHKTYDLFVTYQETPEELQGSKSAAIVQCPTINFHTSKNEIQKNLYIWDYGKALEYSQMRFGRREMLSRIQKALIIE